MTKEKLIKKILDEVEKNLNQSILEQFDKFKIKGIHIGSIEIECYDKVNDRQNDAEFTFNWYN